MPYSRRSHIHKIWYPFVDNADSSCYSDYLRNGLILIFQNSKFWNFNYDYNSWIELNPFGGYIEINTGDFDTFSSCGALIRNKRYTNYTKRYPYDNYEDVYADRANNYAGYLNSFLYGYPSGFNPFSCSYYGGSSIPCFSITIESSNFYRFGFMRNP